MPRKPAYLQYDKFDSVDVEAIAIEEGAPGPYVRVSKEAKRALDAANLASESLRRGKQLVERSTMSVGEVAAYLGISRVAAYEACKRGDIEASRIGRRWIVPIAPLRRKFGLEEKQSDPWG